MRSVIYVSAHFFICFLMLLNVTQTFKKLFNVDAPTKKKLVK